MFKLFSSNRCRRQEWGYGEPNVYVVWSDYCKDFISRRNKNKSKIVVGSPNINSLGDVNSGIKSRTSEKLILIIDQNFQHHGTWSVNEEIYYYNFLFKLSNIMSDYHFVVKFKERFPIPKHLKDSDSLPKNFSFTDKNLLRLISDSDLVLSVHSTVLLESLFYGKKIGCFDWFDFSNPFVENEVGFSLPNLNPVQASKILINELNKNHSDFISNKEKFVNKFYGDKRENIYSKVVSVLN